MDKLRKLPVKGLITLVTGSASGLGSHVRQRLALKGSKVLALDTNHKTIVEEDTSLKASVSFVTGDVTDDQFMQQVFTKYSKCDAVVNCAAYRKAYNYLTSYIVSKHALDVMKNNQINSLGCRGCIINIIGMRDKYDQKYFEEQELMTKKLGQSIESIDDKVFELAEQLTASRIRCNTIIVPQNSDLVKCAELIHNIIEDQYVAGQIISMQDDLQKYLGSFSDIFSEYHVPSDPKKIQLRDLIKEDAEKDTPVLKLESSKNDK